MPQSRLVIATPSTQKPQPPDAFPILHFCAGCGEQMFPDMLWEVVAMYEKLSGEEYPPEYTRRERWCSTCQAED